MVVSLIRLKLDLGQFCSLVKSSYHVRSDLIEDRIHSLVLCIHIDVKEALRLLQRFEVLIVSIMADCASRGGCVGWVETYLKDCVCGVRDHVSLGLGLISIFSWAVAAIPQIVTNFKSGSTEGISLAFLVTYVVGDLFNLIGCLLQSTTLPTQLYMAVLDTISTVVLIGQTVYYDHICKWWKVKKGNSSPMKQQEDRASEDLSEHKEPLNLQGSIDHSAEVAKKNYEDLNKLSNGSPASSLPIPSPSPNHLTSIARNIYYMFARSPAISYIPNPSSDLAAASRESGWRSPASYTLNQSLVNDARLLTNIDLTKPKNSKTNLRSVAATVFFVGGFNYFYLQAIPTFDYSKIDSMASVLPTGRKILQVQEVTGTFSLKSMIDEHSRSHVGTCLGWLMAAIYMGGSLRQIFHNVQRGTIEGLNSLFMFSLMGNAAYVGSIIVKTLEWKKLKPNLPWLVDAAVCVLLDCFILAQFIYYNMRKPHCGHEVNIIYYNAIDP